MENNFLRAFGKLLQFEGIFSNDPDDPGGITKYGISKKSFPNVDIENLTLDEAISIYKNNYWGPFIENIHCNCLREKLFLARVNIGKAKADKILQMTVNKYFKSSLKEDGILGRLTVATINKLLLGTDNCHKLKILFGYELAKYYESLNKKRFLKGWLLRALD